VPSDRRWSVVYGSSLTTAPRSCPSGNEASAVPDDDARIVGSESNSWTQPLSRRGCSMFTIAWKTCGVEEKTLCFTGHETFVFQCG
jgi:hypothetical protein